jgi:two-component system, response regulator
MRKNEIGVLLVEDDPTHAKMVGIALKDVGVQARIHHVIDGDVAIDFMYGRGQFAHGRDDRQVDVILLDLRLGRMDGFEVLQVLKSDAAMRSMPVVVLSTSDRHEDINRAYACGANAFVTKPLEFRDFARKVREVVLFWANTAHVPASVQQASA